MTHAPNSLQARDVRFTVHPYTNLRQHMEQGPLVITGGEGVWVWDDDGKRYLEGLAGLWCTALGFNEKRLVEAAKRQMERMPYTHVFAGRSSEPVIALAEKLVSMAQSLQARVMTNDFNLNKTATLRGVDVVNINDLARALRALHSEEADLWV